MIGIYDIFFAKYLTFDEIYLRWVVEPNLHFLCRRGKNNWFFKKKKKRLFQKNDKRANILQSGKADH